MNTAKLKEEIALLERKNKLLEDYIELQKLAEQYNQKPIQYPVYPVYPSYDPPWCPRPWTVTYSGGTGDKC